ncbi:hypothetical protein [Pseudomonas sp. NFACC45]|uniref:hypothetical protein n=1 Tax=Pseudomonas sp. NFACC45 TaxID=1566201 RepID=UPI0008DFEAB9|nr:hypothetical protein [Pseudomonas sp. NFACC45]SFH12739.1 hypothetical protein SAMN03159297_03212 [Pseudomonas sp. NFACC45]
MITKNDIKQARELWIQAKERTSIALGKLELVTRALRDINQNFQATPDTAKAVAELGKALEGATQELQGAVREQDRVERQYSSLRDQFDEQARDPSQAS